MQQYCHMIKEIMQQYCHKIKEIMQQLWCSQSKVDLLTGENIHVIWIPQFDALYTFIWVSCHEGHLAWQRSNDRLFRSQPPQRPFSLISYTSPTTKIHIYDHFLQINLNGDVSLVNPPSWESIKIGNFHQTYHEKHSHRLKE